MFLLHVSFLYFFVLFRSKVFKPLFFFVSYLLKLSFLFLVFSSWPSVSLSCVCFFSHNFRPFPSSTLPLPPFSILSLPPLHIILHLAFPYNVRHALCLFCTSSFPSSPHYLSSFAITFFYIPSDSCKFFPLRFFLPLFLPGFHVLFFIVSPAVSLSSFHFMSSSFSSLRDIRGRWVFSNAISHTHLHPLAHLSCPKYEGRCELMSPLPDRDAEEWEAPVSLISSWKWSELFIGFSISLAESVWRSGRVAQGLFCVLGMRISGKTGLRKSQ